MKYKKKFINQPNLKLMLQRKSSGNPRLDAEDLPKETYEDCSKLLGELRQVDYQIGESLKSKL